MTTIEIILFVAILIFAGFCIYLTIQLDNKQKELIYYVTVNNVAELLMKIDNLTGQKIKILPIYWDMAADYIAEGRSIQKLEDQIKEIQNKKEDN